MSPGALMCCANESRRPRMCFVKCRGKLICTIRISWQKLYTTNLSCFRKNPDFCFQNKFDSFCQSFCCFSGFELCDFQDYVRISKLVCPPCESQSQTISNIRGWACEDAWIFSQWFKFGDTVQIDVKLVFLVDRKYLGSLSSRFGRLTTDMCPAESFSDDIIWSRLWIPELHGDGLHSIITRHRRILWPCRWLKCWRWTSSNW